MPDEPFQRAWSEDLLCPWRIYEDGDGHLNCPNGLDQGPVPDKDAINTLNQLHQSYYGVTLHVSPQPDISVEVVGDRSMSENGHV